MSDWDLSKTLWDFTYLYWNLTGGEGERDFCNPEVHAGIAVLGVALAGVDFVLNVGQEFIERLLRLFAGCEGFGGLP